MKSCTKCGRRRRLSSFVWNKKEQRHASWCRDCTNSRIKTLRASPETKKRNLAGNQERRRRLRASIDKIKLERGCADCRQTTLKPWQLQFDHVRGKKVRDISQMLHAGQVSLIFEEIEKCEVVCANCHADRTHHRRQNTGVVV